MSTTTTTLQSESVPLRSLATLQVATGLGNPGIGGREHQFCPCPKGANHPPVLSGGLGVMEPSAPAGCHHLDAGWCHACSLPLLEEDPGLMERVDVSPGRCWSLLFDGEEDLRMNLATFRSRLAGRLSILKANPGNNLAWAYMEIEPGPVWHVGRVFFKPLEGMVHISRAINMITLAIKAGDATRTTLIGLTSIMVLGTIGDVQPAVEAASANYCEAEMQRAMHVESSAFIHPGDVIDVESGSGPPLESLVQWDPCLASLLRPHYVDIRHTLMVSGAFLRQFGECPWEVRVDPPSIWVGNPKSGPPLDCVTMYMLMQGEVDVIPLPSDSVMVTHPEHEVFVRAKYPALAFRPVPVPVHDFIRLGQDLMNLKGMFGLKTGLHQLHDWIRAAFEVFVNITQESDLVYLVSGAVVSGLISRAYPDKKVFEVCPVPRASSGTCPEFYLQGLLEGLSLDPGWSKSLNALLDTTLAKVFTKHYGVPLGAGVATRIQAAPAYALKAYGVSGPRVTYKTWARFRYRSAYLAEGWCAALPEPPPPTALVAGVAAALVPASDLELDPGEDPRLIADDGLDRTNWSGSDWRGVQLSPGGPCKCGFVTGLWCLCSLQKHKRPPEHVAINDGVPMSRTANRPPRVFFSMGSCETLSRATTEFARELSDTPMEIVVDARWAKCFPPGRAHTMEFAEHSEVLGEFDVVVHHGGAGVTFTCCEVGVWQMVLPQVGDQFEWSRFLKRIGFSRPPKVSDIPSLAGTGPGRLTRKREQASPILSACRYYRLPHWSTVEGPQLATRDVYEKAHAEGLPDQFFWHEVYWANTGSTPVHYTYKTPAHQLARAWRAIVDRYGVDGDDVLERIGKAVFAEIGFSSLLDILRQTPYASIVTRRGTGKVYLEYLWLLRDACNHFISFAERVGVQTGFKQSAPLPHCEYASYVPTFLRVPTSITKTADLDAFVGTLPQPRPGFVTCRIYLRSLMGHALGRNFGILHATVQYRDKYYELQRVCNGRVFICVWDRPPELLGSPILKVIDVPVRAGSTLPINQLKSVLDGNMYRSAGDNCLFFANLLVYTLTGKVVPWHHFGLYGAELPTQFGHLFGQWLEGVLMLREDDTPIPLVRWSSVPETGFAKNYYNGALPAWVDRGAPPDKEDYGVKAYWVVTKFLCSPEVKATRGELAMPNSAQHLAWLASTRFGLTSAVLHRALQWTHAHSLHFVGDEMDLLVTIGRRLEIAAHNPVTGALRDAVTGTKRWWGLSPRKKVVWAPLFTLHMPHHWFYAPESGQFKSNFRASDNVMLAPGYRSVKLDLRQIAERYAATFPEVAFPELEMERVSDGEFVLKTRVPLRPYTKEVDTATAALVSDLLAASGGQVGVYSMRYATPDMAEQVTDRYFNGVPEGFLSEERKQTIAEAMFRANETKYSNMKLAAPEDVFKKWHTAYSAGFPYRFNPSGNAKRADLMHAAGGKKKFLEAIRRYIAEPDKFPTVSHAFVKDEVLPEKSRDAGKVRTIMAQDVLSYFTQSCVEGDLNKRLDPTSFIAVGVSPQHGELASLAQGHRKFANHYASDITTLDSRMARDYLDVVTRVRKMGFAGHPQEAAACELLDVCAENIYASWVVDIHSGRSRFKQQGASTGHASTTPTNSMYVEAMFLDTWLETTQYTPEEFYELVRVSTYADDNFYSTNVPRSVFGPETIQDHLARRGVHLKLEAEGDKIDDVPFLAKWFSTKETDIAHVDEILGHRPKVCVLHDRSRLVMKFSDIKGKSTLINRWDRAASFLENCAHHPDLHQMVWDYMQVDLAPRMAKRRDTNRWMQKRRPKPYPDVLRLMYLSRDSVPVVPQSEHPTWDAIVAGLEEARVGILAWDGTLNSFSRIIERWSGTLSLLGMDGEKTGADVTDYAKAHMDSEFILERHLYMHAGCPSDLQSLSAVRSHSPFSAFLRLEEFFRRRQNWTYGEADKSMLNAGVACLQAVYALCSSMEQLLRKVPLLGAAYRAYMSMRGLTAEAYANLNALFYTCFGTSSQMLSALIPRDGQEHIKFAAISMWGRFTHLLPDLPEVDWANLRDMVDGWLGVLGMAHSLVMDGQLWLLAPVRDNPSAPAQMEGGLMHEDAVALALEHLKADRVPMITAPTGAGKSTDFVRAIAAHFKTTYLCLPRRILVETNPVIATRVFAGSEGKLTEGAINGVTHGYARVALPTIGPQDVVLLDEFHELDEDALALLERFRGQVMIITATPAGLKGFEEVRLTQSRVSQYVVTKSEGRTPGRIEDKVVELLRCELQGHKTMVIIPSHKRCEVVAKALGRQVPGLRVKLVWKGDTTTPEADVYVCTSVVDAGITIPGVTAVIDSGLSVGFKGGTFGTFPSSRAVAEQRAGRTGRTCNGLYVRLTTAYDETKFDFSTAFASNHRDLARVYGEKRTFRSREPTVPWLSGFYNDWVYKGDFSACVFWWLLAEARGNIDTAKHAYGAMQTHPSKPEYKFIYDMYGNQSLQPWDHVCARVSAWRLEGGNFISPHDGSITTVEIPIPSAHFFTPMECRRYDQWRNRSESQWTHGPALEGVFGTVKVW